MSFEDVLAQLRKRGPAPDPQTFVREQTSKAVDRSVVKALETTPDSAAKHYGIAKREGLSVDEAQRQAEQLRVTSTLQGFSSQSLTERYPDTAKVFADPRLAAIGWDDLQTIKAMEQAQLDLKSAPERYLLSIKGAGQTSLEQNQLNLYGADAVFRTVANKELPPEDVAEKARLQALQQNKLNYGLEGVTGTVTKGANIAVEGLLGSMVDILGGKAVGSAAGAVAGGLIGLRGGPAGVLRGAKTGARIGGEAGGYLGASVPMVGSLWNELESVAPDLDPKSRAWISIVGGASGGLLEKAGFDSIVKGSLKAAMKDDAFKRTVGILSATLGESMTEGGQALIEVTAILSSLGAFTPELSDAELQAQRIAFEQTGGLGAPMGDPETVTRAVEQFEHVTRDGQRFKGMQGIVVRVLESMAEGAIGGGYASTVGAAGKASYDVAAPMMKAQAAKAQQAALEQVVKIAAKTKFAQRNPEALRDATAKMMPDAKIHISAEGVRRFFQDGDNELDDEESYNKARGFREQVQQASLTGADMVIPYADWIAYVAPTTFGRATMKDVRVSDPTSMTANEAEGWEKENFGGFKGVQDFVAVTKKASDVEKIVREELRTQIGRKGGSEQQTEVEVELQLERVKTRAARLGKSLRALIKDEGLFTTTVEGEESQNLGPALEKKLRQVELRQAVKDLRSQRGPEDRMKKSPVLSLLAQRGVDPESRLGRTLRGMVPTKGKGSIPGFWRRGGYSEADQLQAYEYEIFTDNALVDETGYLTNDQLAELVNDELQGKVLRTQNEQYAIHEAKAAKQETERAIREAGITEPEKLTDDELADQLLAAEQTNSQDIGPEMVSATHESAGVKKKGPPRGAIDITPDLRGVVIRFFKARDGSTMLHEGGHLWLEQLRKDATGPNANPQLERDWQIIKDWLGIRRGDRISEKNSERFARAVEQYLMEGNAPSTKLESVFERYAVWLLRIYKTLRNKYFKDVRLTDPVRGVLDRMLATDAQIFAAQQNRGMRGEVLSVEDGLTVEEVAQLREAVEAGRQEAEMENVRMHVRRQRRRALKLWKDNLEKVRAEVTQVVDSRPDVQASQWIRYGKAREGMEFPPAARQVVNPGKLSKEGLVAVAGTKAILKVLTSGKYGYYQAEGGYDPGFVADIFGYATAGQLLSDLSDLQNAGGREAIIERMTEATMEKRFGKFDESAALSDLVVEAAANEKAVRALELEDRVLSGRTGKKRLAREVADRIAKNILSKMLTGDILPKKGQPRASERYRAAAEREAREALKAHANGDLRNMQLHRQRQLVNLAIEREARSVEQRVLQSVARISKLQNPHAQAILGKAGDGTTVFKDQLAKLLVRFGFPSAVKNPKPSQSLADFATVWSGKGANFRIAPDLFTESFAVDYTQLTTGKFFDVAQAIMSVYGSARTLVEANLGAESAALETDIQELIDELKGKPPAKTYATPKTTIAKLRDWRGSFFAGLKQMEHLIDRIGPTARELLWRPLADAEARAFDLTEQTIEPVTQAFKALVKSDKAYGALRAIPSLRTTTNPDGLYTKSDLLMMACNMMNASNAEKMTKGFGLTEAQVWNVLEAELGDADWDFVDLAIDRLESLWPLAVAQELRLTGTAPQPIQPRPHTLPSGRVLKGGYFPVIYDPTAIKALGLQLTSTMRSETDIFSVRSGLQRVVTGHTHMIERVDMANAPISLDINGLPNHLLAVIHDLTHREPLLRAYKLIKDPGVYKALVERVGVKEADLFAPWISDIAQYQAEGNIATQEIYNTHRLIRARLLILTLGGRLTTLMLQPLGTFVGYVLAKRTFGSAWKSYHASEMGRMISSPRRAADFARSKSAMMRRRTHTYDRDYAEMLQSSYGTTGKLAQIGESAMGLLGGVQFFTVDVPLWNAAYAAAKVEKGLSDAEAIDLADAMVEKSQGSGSVKNRSAYLRDRGLLSYLTMYFTYHNTVGNIAGEGRRAGITGRKAAGEYLLMFVIPALAAFWQRQLMQEMEELIGIEDPDEEENKLVQMFASVAAEPMGILPGMRDISSAVSQVGSGQMFDPSTPQEQIMEWTGSLITETGRTVKALEKGDSPRNALVRMVADMARLAALYFKAPAGYMIGLVEKGVKEK